MPLSLGTVLNDIYTIERVLGVGGFGVTYRAWDSSSGQFVAIKENFPSFLAQRDDYGAVLITGDESQYKWALRHFQEEAALLTKMNHPGIVRAFATFNALNTSYIVMEYVEGSPLSTFRRPGEWTEEELRYLLTSLLDVLVYMQKRNICHRDIKPANIMLRTTGHPVLIDFGAAKREVSDHSYSCNFMSNGYTSPEQLADLNCIAPSIDVYALGASFYYLLTGNAPPPVPERQLNPEQDTYRPLLECRHLRKRFTEQFLESIDTALQLSVKRRFSHASAWLKFLNAKYKPARKKKEKPLSVTKDRVKPSPNSFHDRKLEDRVSLNPQVQPQSYIASENQRSSASACSHANDDVIPLPTVLRWAANILLALGGVLFICILATLGGQIGSSYALDSCLPLALFLLVLGGILRLILRFSHFSDT